jgi:hypothetical protein
MHISAFVGVPVDNIVRLASGAHAEINDQGVVTIVLHDGHAVTLSAEQMYELIIWGVECHLSYLDFKAHEFPRQAPCFECGEPIVGTGYIYDLDEGSVELCAFCHSSVAKTVGELQK